MKKQSHPRPRRFPARLVLVAIVASILSLLPQTVGLRLPGVLAANPAPVQTFYVTLPEADALAALNAINSAAVSPATTYFSIAVGVSGTYVYYDQWENGYDSDIANPTNLYSSSNTGGTQIWGNSLAADGCAPNKNGTTVTCTDANDVFVAGDVILPTSSIPIPRNSSTILFDARDKVGASSSIAMARASWAAGSATLNAIAHEMYATAEWGTAYESPVGTNTAYPAQGYSGQGMFEYSALSIMAAQNNTTVQIDKDANGTYESSVVLQEGGATLVTAISQGARVVSDQPIQVVLVTGDIGSSYESRDMNLLPVSAYGSSYWSPVGVNTGLNYTPGPTRLFLYNPSANASIYITCVRRAPTPTTVTQGPVAARGIVTVDLNDNSGAHCFASTSGGVATTDKISGIGTVDTAVSGTSAGQAGDWSFTLYPDAFLSTDALVGLGLGRDPTSTTLPTENGSPLWVTPMCDTYIYVDWNNDGTADKVDFSGNGDVLETAVDGLNETTSNAGFLVTQLKSVRLYKPSPRNDPYDQSGARVWSRTASGVGRGGTPGCNLALAWGQDPRRASAAAPGLDVGTSVPPLRLIEGTKSLALKTDADGDGLLSPGDTATYNITVKNTSAGQINNVYVYDAAVPANTTYVANTTQWSTDGINWTNIGQPDGGVLPLSVSGGVLLGNLAANATLYVRFDINLSNTTPGIYTELTNCDIAYTGGGTARSCTTNLVASNDWGDLPDTYGTSLAANGPRHSSTLLILGTNFDRELQGQPSGNADGDDLNQTTLPRADDEDGIVITGNQGWQTGAGTVRVTVANGPGCLNGWVDFTNDAGGAVPSPDGNFTKTGGYDTATVGATTYSEYFIQNVKVNSGTTDLTVSAPPGVFSGASGVYFRFRLSPPDGSGNCTTVIAPTGYVAGGEVEDYYITPIDLAVTKTDGLTTVQPGQTLVYTLTVTNAGPGTATGVALADTIGSYLTYQSSTCPGTPTINGSTYTWTLANLAAGGSASCTVTVKVASTLPDGTTNLSNYAWVSANGLEVNVTNNEVSDVDQVTAHPDLTIAKALASTPPASKDSVATYRLSGGNIGHATATGVTIVDTLDTALTYNNGSATLTINGSPATPTSVTYNSTTHQLSVGLPNLAPGDTYVLTYTGTVSHNPGANLVNTAVISEAQTDANSADNTATASVPTSPDRDVYVVKSAVASPDPAQPGGQIVYTLAYGNNGSQSCNNVTITDALPANTTFVSATGGGTYNSGTGNITWNLGTLNGGASGTVSFTVQVVNPLAAGVGAIANTATISTSSNDSNTSNNTSSTSTPVTAQPDLRVTKDDSKTQVLAGEQLHYVIGYSNVGNQNATGVVIVDTLPANVTYVSSSPACSYSAPALTCTIGNLGAGASGTIDLVVNVQSDQLASAVVLNHVSIDDDHANGTDPNPSDNSATDSDTVIAPYVVIEKTAAGLDPVSGQVTYAIYWYNNSTATAANVQIVDTPPANTTLVPGSITGGGTESGGVITWNLGSQPPGTSGTVSFKVTVNPGAGGASQTAPTLSTETGTGSVTVTSKTTAYTSLPWCDSAFNPKCLTYRGLYQGADGVGPAGWAENPRATAFDDTLWTQPVAAAAETFYWLDASVLSAEWTSVHTASELNPNFSFFRQAFCLPLNASNLGASLRLSSDDTSKIHLNGNYVGQHTGAGGYSTLAAGAGIQSGINILAVQLLNNSHSGHPVFGGGDHSGLLFNLQASYGGLRPFVYAPATVLDGQLVTFSIDENGLGGRRPYSYMVDFGDSNTAPYQSGTTFNHTYAAPGTYVATVTARAQYGCTGTDQVTITVLPSTSNLLANPASVTYQSTSGTNYSGQSGAGIKLLGAIGDTVWLDENGNGVQDAGEAGIANVLVTATKGSESYTTYTDANGGYLFTDLGPGNWTVTVTPPAGLNGTYDEDSGTVSPDSTAVVNLSAGGEHMTADFGYNWAPSSDVTGNSGTGAIGDRAWIDANGNGVQDPGEPGLAGATVTIYYDPDGDGVYDTPYPNAYKADGTPVGPSGSVTTDPYGNYIFDGLAAGAYVVQVTLPGGYSQTGDPDQPGMPCTACDNKTTTPLVLGPGDVYVNADFGYRLTSGGNTIGNQIFLDANGDGNLDTGEPGIAGVTVALLDSAGKVVATTTTDANGDYTFQGLPDGTYTVWVNDTANVLGGLAQSSTPNNASDGGQPCGSCTGRNTVTVSGGTGNVFQDFGYTPAGQTTGKGLIGDTIFLDLNGNRSYEAGEGLEGVTVRLYDDANNNGVYDAGERLLAQAATDENGNYYFANLPAGNYVVAVDTTTLPGGVTNTVDPNQDGVLNQTGVTLAAGQINLLQDLGYKGTNSVSGTIWVDTDANGTMNGAETGRLAGVTVTLYDSHGNIVATTVTDASGNYAFSNLPDGTYTVDVTDGANVLDGYWHSLGTAGTDGDSQSDPLTVTLSGNTTITYADFGYYRIPATVGNWVWDDKIADGIQDPDGWDNTPGTADDEVGIAGVQVTLTLTWPDSSTTVIKTTTDANGYYSFGNLLQDESYAGLGGSGQPTAMITVATPAFYIYVSPTGVGGDRSKDSGLASGETITVAKGSINDTYDFGFTNQNPTAVELLSFTATGAGGAITLRWETANEVGVLGFNLYRADKSGGPQTQLNDVLIESGVAPGSAFGASYQYVDITPSAGEGTTFFYWLEVVGIDGRTGFHGPLQVNRIARPAE